MNKLILIILLPMFLQQIITGEAPSQLIQGRQIKGDLTILSYNPLQFNLSFNAIVPLPQFQLLFHQIPIEYNIPNSNQSLCSYIIQANNKYLHDPQFKDSEKYAILFSEPLAIANGSLSISSYILRAHRLRTQSSYIQNPTNVQKSQFQLQNYNQVLDILAMVIAIVAYVLAYTTIGGVTLISFLCIYCYLIMQENYFTIFGIRLSYYLLMQVNQITTSYFYKLLYILTPHILLASSFIIGLISRVTLQKLSKKSALCNYIYYFLSYKLLIITWQVVFTPIFANVVHLIKFYNTYVQHISPVIIIAVIYYGILVMILYTYLAYFAANPQIGQSLEKFDKYKKTDHFQHFSGLYFGVDSNSWSTRNFKFIISLTRIGYLILISLPGSSISVIFIQIVFMSYLFLTRPFKYDLFNVCNIIAQFLTAMFYIFRYLVWLYISISQQIATSTQINSLLLSNIIFVNVITAIYTFLGLVQLVVRIKNLGVSLRELDYRMKFGDIENRKAKNSIFKPKSEGKIDPSEYKKLIVQKSNNLRKSNKSNIKNSKQKPKSQNKNKQKGKSKQKTSSKDKHIRIDYQQKTKNGFQYNRRKISSRKQSNKQQETWKQQSVRSQSMKSVSQRKQKWNNKLKQKSSLLQSISLQIQKTSPKK